MKSIAGNLKKKLKENNYKVFSRPFELNIVALRKAQSKPGNFDDELHVFSRVSANNWVHHVFNLVSDPGTFWMGRKGKLQQTLMLAQGQYLNCYSIFKKNRDYSFLKQTKPVNVYPGYDRKAFFDLFTSEQHTGMYNINLLSARSNGKYLYLTPEMEGAQVFQRKDDFEKFMSMCKVHEKLHGNSFTYTLIDERAQKRKAFVKIGVVTGFIIALIGIFIGTDKE